MNRKRLIAAIALLIPAAPALADPPALCQMEEQGTRSPPCPPYVTYDEEGEEVSGAATVDSDRTEMEQE